MPASNKRPFIERSDTPRSRWQKLIRSYVYERTTDAFYLGPGRERWDLAMATGLKAREMKRAGKRKAAFLASQPENKMLLIGKGGLTLIAAELFFIFGLLRAR